MRVLKTRTVRIVGPVLALAAVAVLALSGVATAKEHGHHARDRHRHHHHRQLLMATPEAGTISSFDTTTGKLAITLTEGETVTGLVTEGTEIKCPAPEEGIAQRRDGGGEPGDDGEQGEEPGDDNGGQGEEPGDDNGGDSGQVWSGDEGGGEGCDHHEAGQGSCTVASLIVGTVVGAAELRLEGGKAVFSEIDLGSSSTSTAS